MASCPEPDILLDFLEGRLGPTEVAALRGHLAGCQSCLQVLVHFARTHSAADPEEHPAADRLAAPLAQGPLPLPQGTFDAAGRFQILRCLGAGGMGVVFEALDRKRNLRVALKTIRVQSGDGLLRFKNEFRALQDIQHENLVTLGELIEEGGQWFLTMELVIGRELISYVRSQGAGAREDDAALLQTQPAAGAPRFEATPSTGGAFDESRLRAAFGQLVRGLMHLHGAGKVHRDVKPHNVLVTAAGRVVLLDFGLVADDAWDRRLTESGIVGTVAYMAPEQAACRPVGPAADYYAVGVMLYEALTGRLPISGSPVSVLARKLKQQPARPRDQVPQVPRDLDDLCTELLCIEPDQRPTGIEVLRRLGAEQPAATGPAAARPRGTAPPFVGRGRELQELEEAFAQARQGRAVAVLVEGDSGLGKSALVRELAARLAARVPELLVLAARCYERESVPYKALDGLMDALSRHMRRLPKEEATALLPRRADLLQQVFPVLSRVVAFAQAPRTEAEAADPHEQRARLFAAVRELFVRLSDRCPLLLIIDDLQWADLDSMALLAEVLREPEAPALLLVATRRTSAAGGRILALGQMQRLELAPLSQAEARELALRLIEQAQVGPDATDGRFAGQADVATLTGEARGHPFFLMELVRHALRTGALTTSSIQPLHLEEVLWSRIAALGARALRLLEFIAVAGTPLDQEVVAQTAQLLPAEFAADVALLRGATLIRTTSVREGEALEPYHDRVREAVLAHLDAERRRACHRSLAAALETSGHASPEALAAHWHGASEPERAATHAARAAAGAAAALAFDRAARLYRLALELHLPGGGEERRLRVGLAGALANTGRGPEAAEVYLRAAQGAGDDEVLDLQRLAAEQLLRSGMTAEGLSVFRSVIRAVGITIPGTPRRALASLLWRRVRLRLRGLRYRERDEAQVPAAELRRIDICWSAATGLVSFDPLRAANLHAHHLLLALRAGEPYRVARALAVEAGFAAAWGKPDGPRAERLLQRAAELAHRLDHPHALGFVAHIGGLIAYHQGRWRRSFQLTEKAAEIFRSRRTGVAAGLDNTHLYGLWALNYLGEMREVIHRAASLLREARERGDLYTEWSLLAGLPIIRLAQDDVDRARQDLVQATRQGAHAGMAVQAFYGLFAQAKIALYVGDGSAAHRCCVEGWRAIADSGVLRASFLRAEWLILRAGSALAAAILPGADREGLLRAAEREVRRLKREDAAWARGLVQLITAGVAAARSQRQSARSLLAAAALSFDAAEMALHAAAARRRQGELLGGEEGESLIAAADAWMANQSIKDPRRMTALLAPGFES